MGVPVKVLALCVGQRSVFSSPTPAAAPGLLAAAQGGLDSPREDVRPGLGLAALAGRPPLAQGRWEAGVYFPGGWARAAPAPLPGDDRHSRTAGLRSNQAWAGLSAQLLSSYDLSVLLCKVGHTS